MTLENLIGKSLERVNPDPLTIKRLLEAAKRNIQDAEIKAVSNENRFDAAYKAIMQLANAALQSNGYRTLTSKPGHHQTMIQSLPKTIGIDISTMVVLDALRKQRNVADYTGDLVTESVVEECIGHAKNLFAEVSEWIESAHPDLF
jgi:hypothetical protein